MRFCASISFLFTELPFLERFAAAKKAGFSGVEIQMLPDIEFAAMARAAQDAGIEVVLLNVGMGDLLDGGPGLSGVPGREKRFRNELARALEASAALNARYLHIGPCRIPAGTTHEQCMNVYLSNVAVAVEGVKRLPGRTQLVIEAMNRIDMPDALLPDVGDAVRVIREQFPGRLQLLFDIYHVAMNGEDVLARFAEHAHLTAHVQFSNMPGRHEPGVGTLDFEQLIAGFARGGYRGWIGAEYRPTKPTLQTLSWLDNRSGPAS